MGSSVRVVFKKCAGPERENNVLISLFVGCIFNVMPVQFVLY